jgi:hypothetical protein
LYKETLFQQVEARHYQELEQNLQQIATTIPNIGSNVAIVLDASASMASSGERAQHPMALGLALTRAIQSCTARSKIYQVGGSDLSSQSDFIQAAKDTDLALSILHALSELPQMVFVITDGYENVREGDVAIVVDGLQQLGISVPIYQIIPAFTSAENIDYRKLHPNIHPLILSHENELGELFARIMIHNQLELDNDLLARLVIRS